MRMLGLTLIELLLTLTVVAIIALAGVPVFRDMQLNQRMTARINGFVHTVFMAKQTAHTRLSEIVICKSPSGRACNHRANWSDGWLLFDNADRDNPPTIDEGEAILATWPGFPYGNIRANRRAFIFRPFEIRSTNGTLVFCDSRGPAFAKAVIISYTGRPRIALTRADGSPLKCPA